MSIDRAYLEKFWQPKEELPAGGASPSLSIAIGSRKALRLYAQGAEREVW